MIAGVGVNDADVGHGRFGQHTGHIARGQRRFQGGEIACPECGDNHVEKALMAPNIAPSRKKGPPISPAQMRAALVELRRQVETNCDYVGERFAEEARKRAAEEKIKTPQQLPSALEAQKRRLGT
jgi:hypothetical protein